MSQQKGWKDIRSDLVEPTERELGILVAETWLSKNRPTISQAKTIALEYVESYEDGSNLTFMERIFDGLFAILINWNNVIDYAMLEINDRVELTYKED